MHRILVYSVTLREGATILELLPGPYQILHVQRETFSLLYHQLALTHGRVLSDEKDFSPARARFDEYPHRSWGLGLDDGSLGQVLTSCLQSLSLVSELTSEASLVLVAPSAPGSYSLSSSDPSEPRPRQMPQVDWRLWGYLSHPPRRYVTMYRGVYAL